MSNKTYVIVRHAPGGQTIVWQGSRKGLLEKKRQRNEFADRGAWFEVRPATESDDLSGVACVQVAPSVMLNR